MNLRSDPVAAIAAAARGTAEQLFNLCLRLPQVGTRVIPGFEEDDDIWILVGSERDNDWNQWIIAVSNETAVGGLEEWVVRRTVWWWGEYHDEGGVSHSMQATGPCLKPPDDCTCRGLTRLYIME